MLQWTSDKHVADLMGKKNKSGSNYLHHKQSQIHVWKLPYGNNMETIQIHYGNW